MACVSPRKTAKGVVYDIQFYLTKKDKKKLYGFTNKRIAERFGEKLETIIASKRTGLRDLDVEDWLLALLKSDPDRYNKLVHWGLAEPSTPCIVLKELVSHFVQDSEVKEQTKKNRQTVGNRLISFFGAERLVDSLTSQDVAAFQTAMASKYAPCTWGRDIKTVKQFFQYAVQEHWLDENPFRHLKGSNQSNPSRFFFVPMDTVKRVLDACPNSEMRLIFSLARFGGLRIPSELQFMEWSDIDVTSDRFIVRSPKKTNKRQQEAGNLTTRVVPMFPELRRAFEEYYADFPEGGSSLLFPQLPTGQALTSRFMKILHRAGVTAWPKFFQNMRSTRETELTDRYPLQDVTSWLGNTPSVAQKHYLQTRPEFYARASRDATFTEEKTIGIEPTRLLETKAVQPSSSIHHEKQLYPSNYDALSTEKFLQEFLRASVKHPNPIGTIIGTLLGMQGITLPGQETPKTSQTPQKRGSTQEKKKPCNCLQGIKIPSGATSVMCSSALFYESECTFEDDDRYNCRYVKNVLLAALECLKSKDKNVDIIRLLIDKIDEE